jgi:hypothetical protein
MKKMCTMLLAVLFLTPAFLRAEDTGPISGEAPVGDATVGQTPPAADMQKPAEKSVVTKKHHKKKHKKHHKKAATSTPTMPMDSTSTPK